MLFTSICPIIQSVISKPEISKERGASEPSTSVWTTWSALTQVQVCYYYCMPVNHNRWILQYVLHISCNIQDENLHKQRCVFLPLIDNIWKTKRLRAHYTTAADFCFPFVLFRDSWHSAIFVYTALALFIVGKAERLTDIKWSLCLSDSNTNWTPACTFLSEVDFNTGFYFSWLITNSNRSV